MCVNTHTHLSSSPCFYFSLKYEWCSNSCLQIIHPDNVQKSIFTFSLVIGVCGQQSNETSTTTTSSTTSAGIATTTTTSQPIVNTTFANIEDINSYSSGLTPQLMRLLDDPVETDETESIFPFEKMNVVAFPRINIESDNEPSTPSPEDPLKVEKQKLETFLHHIAANSDSFTPSKQSYGSVGKLHDEEMEVQQPSSLLNDAKFFMHPKPVQIHPLNPNFHNYPPYFNNRQSSVLQEDFMMPSDCCVPCPFEATAPSIQPSCCQNQHNNCGSFQSSHPSEIQLPGGLGTITEKDVDEFVDNLLERNLQRQQTKRLLGQQPPFQDSKSNNYEEVYNSKYFAVPSNNQNFHSPPKGFGASISAKSAKKSEEKPEVNENQAKKEKFNPNFKFFYQFGDGDLSESKTALYHVNQLKTNQPTVISLRPSTENLLKMLNSQAHGLHMVEVPFEEDSEKDGSEDQNGTVADNKAA